MGPSAPASKMLAMLPGGEADVELAHGAGDDRLGPVEHDPAVLVLVEADEDEGLPIAAGLGDPVSDPPLDLARDRVARARIVEGGVPEEGEDVPRRRHADAEDERVLRHVDQLVDQIRIEAIPEADA